MVCVLVWVSEMGRGSIWRSFLMAENRTTNESPTLWQQFKKHSPLIVNFVYLVPDLTLTVIAGLYAETSLTLLWVVVFVTFCKFVSSSTMFIKYFATEKKTIWYENSHNQSWIKLLLYGIAAMVLITSFSIYFSKTGTVMSLANQLGLNATMPKMVALFAIVLGLWCVLDSLTRANLAISYFGWLLRRCFVAKPKQVQYLTISKPKYNCVSAIPYADKSTKDVFLLQNPDASDTNTSTTPSEVQRFELAMIAKGATLSPNQDTSSPQKASPTHMYRIVLNALKGQCQERYKKLQKFCTDNNIAIQAVAYLSEKQKLALKKNTHQTVDVFFEYTDKFSKKHCPIYTVVEKTKPPFMTRMGKKLQSGFDNFYWKIFIALGTCCFDVIITCYASIAKWPFLIGLIIPCALFGFVETLVYNYKFYREDKAPVMHSSKSEQPTASKETKASRSTWAITLSVGAITMTSALTKFITKFLPAYAIAYAVGAPHLFCVIFAGCLGIACVLRNICNGLVALETMHIDLAAKIDTAPSTALRTNGDEQWKQKKAKRPNSENRLTHSFDQKQPT